MHWYIPRRRGRDSQENGKQLTLPPAKPPQTAATTLPKLLRAHRPTLLAGWLEYQQGAGGDAQDAQRSSRFLDALAEGVESGETGDISGDAWADLRGLLEELSRTKAMEGISTTQIATFVLS